MKKIKMALITKEIKFNTNNKDKDKQYKLSLSNGDLQIGSQFLVTFDEGTQEWFIYFVLSFHDKKQIGFAMFDRQNILNIVIVMDYSSISKVEFDKQTAFWYDWKTKETKAYLSLD